MNETLAMARANSVRDYLVDHGVASAHLQTLGRGEREPLADNGSEAGRARNRRVEIYLREPGR